MRILGRQRTDLSDRWRLGTDYGEDRPVGAEIRDLNLLSHAVEREVANDRLDCLRLGIQPQPLGTKPQKSHVRLHAALAVQEGRVAALPRGERLDVVRELALEELDRVGA